MASGLAGVAAAQERRPMAASANPSAVVAAELAFAQAAQENGQWTAFAQTAARDAVMFKPQMVYAQAWLKGRANPPAAVKWQPHEVWSSCDGSLVVSHGAWQGGALPGSGAQGYFTTIWQRQKDGTYKWVLDSGDALTEPLAAPDMVAAHVADCPAGPRRGPGGGQAKGGKSHALPPLDPARRTGRSDDGTLVWTVTVEPDGARNLSVDWTREGASQTMLIEEVAAPAKR